MPPAPASYPSAVRYRAALVADGWKLLATGGRGGTVYRKAGESFAIKVSEADDCYLAYVKFAASYASSHVPQLSLQYDYNGWAVVHTEELFPLEAADIAMLKKWLLDFRAAKMGKMPFPSPICLSQLLDQIVSIAPQGCGLDVEKTGNVMKRHNGTLVVTDPLG